MKNLKFTAIVAPARTNCRILFATAGGSGNENIPPIARYISGTSRIIETINRFFNASVFPFCRSSFPSRYSPIPYPSAVTAAKISSRFTSVSSYSTERLSPSSDTSADFTPFNFFVTRSTPAEHAEQLIPVTVNFSFVILRSLLAAFHFGLNYTTDLVGLSSKHTRKNTQRAIFSQKNRRIRRFYPFRLKNRRRCFRCKFTRGANFRIFSVKYAETNISPRRKSRDGYKSCATNHRNILSAAMRSYAKVRVAERKNTENAKKRGHNAPRRIAETEYK